MLAALFPWKSVFSRARNHVVSRNSEKLKRAFWQVGTVMMKVDLVKSMCEKLDTVVIRLYALSLGIWASVKYHRYCQGLCF